MTEVIPFVYEVCVICLNLFPPDEVVETESGTLVCLNCYEESIDEISA